MLVLVVVVIVFVIIVIVTSTTSSSNSISISSSSSSSRCVWAECTYDTNSYRIPNMTQIDNEIQWIALLAGGQHMRIN